MSLQAPVPMPRKYVNTDYANLISLESERHAPANMSPCIDSNNNNNNNKCRRHSPTPDYPPPTVVEAEATILNYMQPVSSRLENLPDTESTRTTNSYCSDQVEEFVGDIPFAGLFKGSTLNLSNDMTDGRGSVTREGLRSPSMVRSVNVLNNQRRSLSKQRFSASGEDFSASRVWAEIDTIFENIGNEVLTVEQEVDANADNEPEKQDQFEQCNTENHRQSLHIRNPAELLLGKSESPASHWCHSPYTLVYGEIRYSVFVSGKENYPYIAQCLTL